MTISIGHEADKVLDLPYREIIENTMLAALDHEGCPYEAEVNVILMNNNAMQETNREHRRVDAPTDVLSFPMADCESPSDFDHVEEVVEDRFNLEAGELILGSIVIFMNKVEEQAEKYGRSRTRGLAFLTTHSVLHLLGYDRMEDSERLVMEEKQKEMLETRGYTRQESGSDE